jgi:hypothetical protein
MFEDYIQDSFFFFEAGMRCVSSDERAARRYFRASVFCAASALEAFVNFVGDALNKGGGIDRNELAFINDKALEISPSTATVEERTKFYPIDSKVKFILKKFEVPLDLIASAEWRHFREFKQFRDSLVHPRNLHDEIAIATYVQRIREGLNANIDIMNAISQKLFGKPLRKSLLDLKP